MLSFPKLVTSLAIFLFSLQTWTLTTTLPDGRTVRIPGRKPSPSSERLPLDVGGSGFSRRDRVSGKKPPPGGGPRPANSGLKVTRCGLERPSEDFWYENRENITQWFTAQFNEYLWYEEYDSIALFLRDRWAPDSLDSSLFCNGIGTCSIGDCKNLIPDDGSNHHDRQMALYVLESIANYDNMLKTVTQKIGTVGSYVIGSSNRLVEHFSSAPRIERALKEELRKDQLTMQIATSLAITASAGLGFLGVVAPAVGVATAMGNMAISSYIGIAGLVGEVREKPASVLDLKEEFHDQLTQVIYRARESVELDFVDLMVGAKNNQGHNILDLITNGGFLKPNPGLGQEIADHIGRVMMSTAINKLWEFDRAYFVVVNNPGGCENEKTKYIRGPTEYLVCLPELDHLGFWLYSIDRFHEDDMMHDDQAMVRGPTGFHRLNGTSTNFGLTLQDVARSSYEVDQRDWVEKKGLAIEFDLKSIDATIRAANQTLGKVPGAFTVPMCRNPGGESISGILDKKGTNYPCMCGEFGWRSGHSVDLDQTPRFLQQSGFMFSEDWEDYCSSHNHCKGENSNDLKSLLNSSRQPGDPEIPHDLKHVFKKCKKRRDAKKHPGWPEKDIGEQKQKLEGLRWAEYDKVRNTSRATVGFEDQ